MKLQLVQFTLLMMLLSCSSAKFQGSEGSGRQPASSAESYQVVKQLCDASPQIISSDPKNEASPDSRVAIEAMICHSGPSPQSGPMTALFVIDASGSMSSNDPTSGSSCGRLRAAQAIYEKIKGPSATTSVKFGSISFGTQVQSRVPPEDANLFAPVLTTANFCGSGLGFGASTNYEAAFIEAKNILQGISGPKIVYFISDGFPTYSSSGHSGDHRAAGLRAAQDLRSGIQDLTLNAVFFGNDKEDDSDPQPGVQSTDAGTYLEQITGSKDRVRLVDQADQLAQTLTSFTIPQSFVLQKETVTAVLTAPGQSDRAITIKSIEPAPDRSDAWIITTEPFELITQGQAAAQNTVVIHAKTPSGEDIQTMVVIH